MTGSYTRRYTEQLDHHKSFRFRDILLLLLNRLYPYIKHQIFHCTTGIPDRFWREENVVLELGKGSLTTCMHFWSVFWQDCGFYTIKSMDLLVHPPHTLFLVDEGRILLDADRNTVRFWGELYYMKLLQKQEIME